MDQKIIKREKKIIAIFKSNHENYLKELSGNKNNTFRKIDLTDGRFQFLREGKITHIMITHVDGRHSFVRELRDYTEFDGYCIMTWNHDVDCELNPKTTKVIFRCVVEKTVKFDDAEVKEGFMDLLANEYEGFEDEPIGMHHKTNTQYMIIENKLKTKWKDFDYQEECDKP